jgi:hypothetical protein
VATSATLHSFHPQQPAQPLLNMTLPLTMRRKVVPLTTRVLPEEQYPPMARMPAQPTGSSISPYGSLKATRLMELQPL